MLYDTYTVCDMLPPVALEFKLKVIDVYLGVISYIQSIVRFTLRHNLKVFF